MMLATTVSVPPVSIPRVTMVAKAKTKAREMAMNNVTPTAAAVGAVVGAIAIAIVSTMVQNVLNMATNRPHRSLKCKQNPFLNLI
jgi:hypothetical protein